MKFIGLFVTFLFTIGVIALIGAYPTKWLINYLFTPQVLTAVFGVTQFGFWKALAFNYLFAGIVTSNTSASSK